MRTALAPMLFVLTLAACGSATPTDTPDAPAVDVAADVDAPETPAATCGGLCGPGTVCEGGRCVGVDAGSEMPDVLAHADAMHDAPAPPDVAPDSPPPLDAPAPPDVAPDSPPPLDATADADPCGGCAYPNASAECVRGVCSLVACVNGFGDCNGRNDDGCEVTLNEAANCGACGNRCPTGGRCIGGRCDTGCPAPTSLCFGLCYDLSMSLANCGTCGRTCPRTGTCSGGICCNGFVTGNCDGIEANGCETTLDTRENCGACGNRCPAARPYCAPIMMGSTVTGHMCR